MGSGECARRRAKPRHLLRRGEVDRTAEAPLGEPGENGLARLDGGERLLECGQVHGHAGELHARE